jgi:hypothetical protein
VKKGFNLCLHNKVSSVTDRYLVINRSNSTKPKPLNEAATNGLDKPT